MVGPEDGEAAMQKSKSRFFTPQPERFAANEEPALDELLTDPLVLTLMASDGLAGDALRAEIDGARVRLAAAC